MISVRPPHLFLIPLTSSLLVLACSRGEAVEASQGNLTAKSDDLDRCPTRCHEAFARGRETLAALDSCLDSKCLPPSAKDEQATEEDTHRACGAVGRARGELSYAYGPTDACMARSCCAPATTCAGSPDCRGLVACILECNGAR